MAITIQDYVEQRGVNKVAALCRVTPQTVYNWINHAHSPDPFMCHIIIEDSMNMLSFDSIMSAYVHHNYDRITEHKSKDFHKDIKA